VLLLIVHAGYNVAAGASGANFGWPANQQLEHNRQQAKGMSLLWMLFFSSESTD